MATTFTHTNTSHASSSFLSRVNPIPRMADRLDRRAVAQLAPQPSHADVDPVRARVEVVTPDGRQDALAGHDLAGVLDQMAEHAELPIRQLGGVRADACLAAGEVECDAARPQHGGVG